MDIEKRLEIIKSGDMEFFQWNITMYLVMSIMTHLKTKQLKYEDLMEKMCFMFSPRDIIFSIKNYTNCAIRLNIEHFMLKIWVYKFDEFDLDKLNESAVGYLFIKFDNHGYIEKVDDTIDAKAFEIIIRSEDFKNMIEALYCLINMKISKPEEESIVEENKI